MNKTILTRKSFLKGAAATIAGSALMRLTAFAEENAGGVYTPGTYTATAQGMESSVTVTMTFDETTITDVVIDVSGETEGLGAAAGDALKEQILTTQGLEIDGVSGSSVTSNAVKEAAADCIRQAGGTVVVMEPEAEATLDEEAAINWPINEPLENYTPVAAGNGTIAFEPDPIDEAAVTEEKDVDVLVCGFGPSGISCALSCAQHGLKTLVVEKNDTGLINSMTIGGLHDRIHKMYGVTFDEEEIFNEAMIKNGFRANPMLYKKLIETNGEAVDWWLDQMPFEDSQYPLTFFGYSGAEFPDFKEKFDKTAADHSWNTSINIPFGSTGEMLEHLTGKVLEAGAEILYETPVVQLITDEAGKVIGAYVKNADGYIRVNAAKGVVLATGGYEHNLRKLQECCRPRDLQLCAWLTYARNCTGDGHEMAKAIGAMEDEYPHPLMLDPMQLMPYVRVNSEGKRFIGEYEAYDHLASAIQTQYGGYDYFLTDANVMEAVDNMWSPSSSCYGPKEVWAGAATSPNALVADSLEELAELMGVPADNLVATIDRWNEMCDGDGDVDFGYPKDKMHRIDTAPFYATREMAEALATSGGLQVDEYSRVLNARNQPIEGLFSIGNCSGSMFYGTYPHSLNCLSHTRCVVFGYNIGKYLAE